MQSDGGVEQSGDPKQVAYPSPMLWIGGEWRSRSGTSLVRNPATGAVLGETPSATIADIQDALAAARASFPAWRATPATQRAMILTAAAALIRERLDTYAPWLTREQGKPLAEATTEFLLCAEAFEWFAAEGLRSYGRILPPRAPGVRQMVLPEPVGPVLAMTPWNFPALLAARKIAPALAAGCSCILKPAEETPAAALALAFALSDAGLPAGVLNIVLGDPALIARELISSPIIRKVSFTGSVPVGRALAGLAAEGLKPCTLELGGHAPVIVFDDADVEGAASAAALGKTRNAGQVCTSPTRFFVQDKAYDAFVESLAHAMKDVIVGDGLTAGTMMGPLANERRQRAIENLIGDAVDRGATLMAGGERGAGQGVFWMPTVLADVPAEAQIQLTEPFGPVAIVQRFSDPADAISAANLHPYGLAGYVFTQSSARAVAASEALAVGVVGINSFAVSHIEAPFSGVKESGYGYEGGAEGLDGYIHRKYVNHC